MPEQAQPLGERLAVVETDLKNHRRESGERFDAMDHKQDKILEKIDAFTALLNAAKGIRWILAAIGGYIAWINGVGDWLAKHMIK